MKRKLNKSEEIRKILSGDPGARPSVVVAALAARKIPVTAGLVVKVRAAATGNKSLRSSRKGKSRRGTSDNSFDSLLAAKALVLASGGLVQAQEALKTYSRLVE